MKAETQKQIDELASVLGEQIEIKEGKADIAADAYAKSLPEGVTFEQVKILQNHNSIFFPAVTKAFCQKSIETMKEDKNIEMLELSVPMVGDDKFEVSFKKTYEYTDTSTKEVKTGFGGINASLTVQAARHNRGAMQSIKNELKEAALAAFGKD